MARLYVTLLCVAAAGACGRQSRESPRAQPDVILADPAKPAASVVVREPEPRPGPAAEHHVQTEDDVLRMLMGGDPDASSDRRKP